MGEGDSQDSEDAGKKFCSVPKKINDTVECSDGFMMSVQASSTHYCTPRLNAGPYTHVEVGFPNMIEPLLLPFADVDDNYGMFTGIPELYVNVPAETVQEVIREHGGMIRGQIPELEERDEDGYLWAAAAPIPQMHGSPASAIHMGAPPPPPPPYPPTTQRTQTVTQIIR